jgi:hypothetical protein
MKIISETKALEKLQRIKSDFASQIRERYEQRAKSCATCPTPGACCLDAHFVNVRITRLEAIGIRNVIDTFPSDERRKIYRRIDDTIVRYDLSSEGDTFKKTYACPLFQKGIGCLVHERGKPLPCIAHACYENKEDLPPDELLVQQEGLVENLNELTYRKPTERSPLPVAVKHASQSIA